MAKGARWLSAGVAAALGLQLLGVLLYANSFGNAPVWDDHDFVFNQPFLTDCASLTTILDPRNLYRVLPERNSARPVWLASVAADSCLYGPSRVWGYRLTSAMWHGFGAALLMCLAWLLSKDRLAAGLAGLLFLLHPVHTEAVDIIAFRSELLALAGMLLALVLYLEARARTGRAKLGFLAGAMASGAAAMLAKETAVTLPLLVVLVDALFPQAKESRADLTRRRRAYGAFALIVLAYLAFRAPRSGYELGGREDFFSALRSRAPAVVDAYAKPPEVPGTRPAPQEPAPWPAEYYERPEARLATMSRIFGSYLRLLVWPHPLQGDYAPEVVGSWLDGGALASAAAWLILLAAAWRERRRRPALAFGLFWIPIALLPVSGLVSLRNLEAERYLYAPSAGACLAAAVLFAAALRSRRAAAAGVAAALALMAAATVSRNADYRDDLSFYLATEAVDPGIPRVHFNLAQAYAYDGRPERAELEYREGLRLWPRALKGRLLFARFLANAGRSGEALAQLKAAEEFYPGEPRVAALRAEVVGSR